MTKFDKDYLELVKEILQKGEEVENRTGVNTVKLPSYSFKFNVGSEFPILETKKTYYKNALTEILWIWQVSSNDVRWLQERNNHIWDQWKIDDDGIYRIYEPDTKKEEYDKDKEVVVMDPFSASVDDPFGELTPLLPKDNEQGKVMTAKSLIPGKNIKAAKYYGKEYANTIGTAYGYITGRYNMAERLINSIKNHPTDRRKVFSLWQDEFLRGAVLPSCVWSTEWNVYKDTLNLQVHQRSCDIALGLPFNVTQYASLLKMIAQVTELEPGIVSYSINDPHIYVNHVDTIKEQVARGNRYNELMKYSTSNLMMLSNCYREKLKLLDKDSEEYKNINTELCIIDMILNPEKPELVLDPSIKNFFDFDNSKELKHIKVKNYKNMGPLKFPVVQ